MSTPAPTAPVAPLAAAINAMSFNTANLPVNWSLPTVEKEQDLETWNICLTLLLRQTGLEKYIKSEVAIPEDQAALNQYNSDVISIARLMISSFRGDIVQQLKNLGLNPIDTTPFEIHQKLYKVSFEQPVLTE